MKKFISPLSASKLFLAFAIAGLASGTVSAQVVTLISPTIHNGGFESITAKSTFGVNSSTGQIAYWGATLVSPAGTPTGAPNDSGAEQAAPGTTADNSATHAGLAGSFYQPGGASTAFNLATTHTVQAGELYTLTWFGRITGVGGQQTATLFSQSPNDTPDPNQVTYIPAATLATALGSTPTYALPADRSFAQFTLTYAATAADVGNYVGLTFGNSGTAFIGADDFTLTVTQVPEPSTYACIIIGVGGLLLVRRSRRLAV